MSGEKEKTPPENEPGKPAKPPAAQPQIRRKPREIFFGNSKGAKGKSRR